MASVKFDVICFKVKKKGQLNWHSSSTLKNDCSYIPKHEHSSKYACYEAIRHAKRLMDARAGKGQKNSRNKECCNL